MQLVFDDVEFQICKFDFRDSNILELNNCTFFVYS